MCAVDCSVGYSSVNSRCATGRAPVCGILNSFEVVRS